MSRNMAKATGLLIVLLWVGFSFVSVSEGAPYLLYNQVLEGYSNSAYELFELDLATNQTVLSAVLGYQAYEVGTYNANTGQVYFLQAKDNETRLLLTIDSNTGNVTGNTTITMQADQRSYFMFYDEMWDLIILGLRPRFSSTNGNDDRLWIKGIDANNGQTQLTFFSGRLQQFKATSRITSITYQKGTHMIFLTADTDDASFHPLRWTAISMITLSLIQPGASVLAFNITFPTTGSWASCYHPQLQTILGLRCTERGNRCGLVSINPTTSQILPIGAPTSLRRFREVGKVDDNQQMLSSDNCFIWDNQFFTVGNSLATNFNLLKWNIADGTFQTPLELGGGGLGMSYFIGLSAM